jgi:hypothetical protein
MGSLNKVLLENILPAHVAEHYLYSPRRQDVSARLPHVNTHSAKYLFAMVLL